MLDRDQIKRDVNGSTDVLLSLNYLIYFKK